ncbi:MAG: hypothetical protein AVDCRST_MAG56-2646, partial [uncultured Cytophagales bacterium]
WSLAKRAGAGQAVPAGRKPPGKAVACVKRGGQAKRWFCGKGCAGFI